jgi:hypothetical protein
MKQILIAVQADGSVASVPQNIRNPFEACHILAEVLRSTALVAAQMWVQKNPGKPIPDEVSALGFIADGVPALARLALEKSKDGSVIQAASGIPDHVLRNGQNGKG